MLARPRRQGWHAGRALAQAAEAPARQRASLRHTAHRPWPLPRGPWIMGQSWLDLLFAHWPLPADALRPAVPAGLALDTFAGSARLGITPFEVAGLHPRWLPPLPRLSRFLELNVRTYVTAGGKPGIWFLSLDAASRVAVAGARRAYRLPYHHARMTVSRRAGEVVYASESAGPHRPRAAWRAAYAPAGPPAPPRGGTLEHFLTERYCLYTVDARHRLHRAEIHHPPWPLQPARAEVAENTMTAPYGIDVGSAPPLVHYAARQDVVIWAPGAASERSG